MGKKRYPMEKVIKVSLFVLIFMLMACSNVEVTQHIEVFVTETSEENEEGFFEKTGYKKVNSITTIEESENHIKTDIKAIEDYYDREKNYLYTKIIHSTFTKSNTTLNEDGKDLKKELQQPSTIMIPDDHLEGFQLDHLTDEEKEKVKEHVLSFMDRLQE